MTKLSNPTPIFYDGAGNLLDGGYIYVGTPNADPQVQPIQLYWDFAQTIPADQPLRTIGGVVVNGVNAANVFFTVADFSMRVLDSNQAVVSYSPSTYLNTQSFQPLNSDLTAIAAAGTTPYGIGLLSLANAAALANAAGTAGALQKSGGTMTGAISRQGSGAYVYGDTNLSPVIYAPQPVGSAAPSSPPPGSLYGFY